MAGIYIHIPFCKQKCNYCDFYKTTQVSKKHELVEALISELSQRKKWLQNDTVETIYFGGGTPSLLSISEINRIIDKIFSDYSVASIPEITLESNPDDLTKKQILDLKHTAINRLSIGIQSFQNDQLKKMNRRHTANQAVSCVKQAQDAGYENISTDLIYGLPNLTTNTWLNDLKQMQKLNIQHLSAYHLTYETGTEFDKMLKKKMIIPVGEEESVRQFKTLISWAKGNSFEHYEISNFAKPGFYSKHNTSYWQQEKYLGIGPSAHSYNIETRRWNISNLDKYINGINKKEKYSESETLTNIDKYNEYLMTSMRTMWGVNIKKVEAVFGIKQSQTFVNSIKPFIKNGAVYKKNDNFILSDEGIFISDKILTDIIVLQDE